MPVREDQRRTKKDGGDLRVWDVDSYHSTDGRTSQHAQVGALVERWADVLEGAGEKAGAFWEAFYQSYSSREIPRFEDDWEMLSSNLLYSPPQREMLFVRRGPITIAVLLAQQGADLYTSWRCFIKNPVAWWRVAAVLVVAILIGWPFAYTNEVLSGTHYELSRHFNATLVTFVVLMVLIGIYGLLFRAGDAGSLLRAQIHELQYDEVASLTTVIHKSLIHAADKLGIDTAKLEPRTPVYLGQQQRRRI
jgi:hypothetical protein